MRQKTIIMLCNLHFFWVADYASQTAAVLARENDVFCYLGADAYAWWDMIGHMKSPFEIRDGIFFFHPILLPGRRFHFIHVMQEMMNGMMLRRYVNAHASKFSDHIVWMFDSMFTAFLAYIPASWKILYDCVDVMWDDNARKRDALCADEKKLMKRATWMTVNSHTLFSLHKNQRPDVVVVPQGFRSNIYQHLSQTKIQRPVRPVIGFAGVLDDRIDYPLLYVLASKNPQWDFSFYGIISGTSNGMVEKMHVLPNVSFHAAVPASELPLIMRTWTIGMIPYRMTAFTRQCYPMKLFEYFFMGLPVIATPILELYRFPEYVKIGKTAEAWERHIRYWTDHPFTMPQKKRLQEVARANSWGEKIAAITRVVEAEEKPYNRHERI